jgi:hypothetical protein
METVSSRGKEARSSRSCWRHNVRHRELFRRIHDGAIGDVRAF